MEIHCVVSRVPACATHGDAIALSGRYEQKLNYVTSISSLFLALAAGGY